MTNSPSFPNETVKRFRIAFGYVFLAGLLAYLAFRLFQLNWSDIGEALPTHPLFYLLSVAIFITVPLTELVSYKVIFGRSIPDGFRVFCRKRIFNDALVTYSGEAYLSERLADLDTVNRRDALVAVKDNNLISALISNSWTLVLIVCVILIGRVDILKSIWTTAPVLIGTFGAFCLIIYGLVLLFFKRLSALPPQKFRRIALCHSIKIIVIAILQIAQWSVAIPGEAFQTWIIFLTLLFLLKRIPGLPNTDLLFLTIGLSLTGIAQSSADQFTAMLLAAAAISQLIYFIGFLATTPWGHKSAGAIDSDSKIKLAELSGVDNV